MRGNGIPSRGNDKCKSLEVGDRAVKKNCIKAAIDRMRNEMKLQALIGAGQ
jgi:hypothetical protein